MKLAPTRPTVLKVLQNNTKSRDDDRLLITLVWKEQFPLIEFWSYEKFQKEFINGKLFHTESIRRNRAILQNKYPELQGKNYKKRKEHQMEVKKEIIVLEMGGIQDEINKQNI